MPNTTGPLAPYRVLDLTGQQGFLCGRILGDLGADVINIEPPGGDPARRLGPFYHDEPHPDRSLSYWAYNLNKRSVELDLESRPGRAAFKRLARTADFIVESLPRRYLDGLGLGYEDLSARNPGLIVTSISPFGSSGPYRDYRGGDLIAMAAGGLMYLAGAEERRPVVVGVPQAANQAAAQAAVGTLIAHHHRQATGRGQWIDVSTQEAVVNSLDWVQQYYDIRQVICKRGTTPGLPIQQNWIWEAKDGYVSWVWWVGAGWGRKNIPLIEMMAEDGDDAGLLAVPWEDMSFYKLTRQQVDPWEEAWARFFKRHTVAELVREAQRRRFLLYPVNSPQDVVASRQLEARRFFTSVKPYGLSERVTFPGPVAKSNTPLWTIRRPAAKTGQHTAQVLKERRPPRRRGPSGPARSGPALQDLKVADFTWLVAGPVVGKYLAMHGATVVKVEFSKRLDGTRQSGPFQGKPTFNSSGHFANHNAGKLSLGVNLDDPRGLEVARRLVRWADVLVENFTHGVLKRWGLDYANARKINPALVMLSSSFQGQTGPAASQSGYASLLHALSGIDHVTGWRDLPPSDVANAYGDLIGCWFGIASILAALERRRQTGEGAYIDLSQFEAAVHFLSPAILDYTVNDRVWQRDGNASPDAAPHGAYACLPDRDLGRFGDRWCAIAAYTEEQWQALCRVMGGPAWTRDSRFATNEQRRRNATQLDPLIDAWTNTRRAEDVMRLLQEAGVPAGVVANARDLHQDPQLRARDHLVRLDHPEMGSRTYDAPSFRLSQTPHRMRRAPLLGEHTQHVATDLLGLSDEEFIELLEAGVLEQP